MKPYPRCTVLFALLVCTGLPSIALAESGATIKETVLMQKPFSDAKTLATLPARTNLQILGRQGGWMRVKASGKTGWIRMLNVRVGMAPAAGRTSAKDVAALATGRSGSGNIVATSGIRGLSEEELKSAKGNPEELKKMSQFTATENAASDYAQRTKLKQHSLNYLPTPGE